MNIEIQCDGRAVQELRIALAVGTEARFIERKNLSGDAASWLVFATLAGGALPHVLEFMVKWRELGRVKRIKIGDIEIDNPSPDDVASLRKRLEEDPARHDAT